MKRVFIDKERTEKYKRKRRNLYLFLGFLFALFIVSLGLSLHFASRENANLFFGSMSLFGVIVLIVVFYSLTMIAGPLSFLIRNYSDATSFPHRKIKGTVLSVRTIIERNVEFDEIALSAQSGEMLALLLESGEFPSEAVGKTLFFDIYERLIVSYSEEDSDE